MAYKGGGRDSGLGHSPDTYIRGGHRITNMVLKVNFRGTCIEDLAPGIHKPQYATELFIGLYDSYWCESMFLKTVKLAMCAAEARGSKRSFTAPRLRSTAGCLSACRFV